MAEPWPRGLGLGLSALLGDGPAAGGERLLEIPLDQLRPNARQPRAHFDDAELAELVASITRDGVLQPVLARPAQRWSRLRADRRRAPLAGREGGRPRRCPRDRARRERPRGAGAGARRERGAHRPRPDRGGPGIRASVRRDGPHAGECRRGGRPQPRLGDERAATARPARRGDLDARAPRAERGPRPCAPARARSRDATEARGEAVRRSWSVRALETAARAAAGRREPTPTRRRAGTPAWLDAAAADDLVDAAFAALGLPARIATRARASGSSCAYGMRASSRGSAMRSGPLVCSELARAISSVG